MTTVRLKPDTTYETSVQELFYRPGKNDGSSRSRIV